MRCPLPLNVLALSLALGVAGTASAATPAQLAELLKQLTERVNKLEAANTQLQHELAASRSTPSATQTAAPTLRLEQRLQALEQQQTQLADNLAHDTISEKEPELSTRLKAVEAKTQELSAPVAKLKSLADEHADVAAIDVCTGCGNLALAMAHYEPRAMVYGADLSEDAIGLAQRNVHFLGLQDRVQVRCGDLLGPFNEQAFYGRVDLLVCNPPYISSGKLETLPSEIIAYEPRLAFDGGPFGVRILQRLMREAPRYLRFGGWLAFEVGLG